MSYDEDEARRFLMGGKVRSAFAKGDAIGKTITGTVTEPPRVTQQIDYETNEPATWADGHPKMHLVVTLQTNLNEPTEELPEDDGLRRIYVKGDLQKAIQKAVNDAHADNIEPGGVLTVVFTGLGKPGVSKSGRPLNPPRIHSAMYQPPSTAFLKGTPRYDDEDPWSNTPPAQTPPPPARTPPPPPPPPPLTDDDPFANMGLTPEQRAAINAVQQQNR